MMVHWEFVHSTEVVRFSECPFKVPTVAQNREVCSHHKLDASLCYVHIQLRATICLQRMASSCVRDST